MSEDLREVVAEAVEDATADLREEVEQLRDERDELADRVDRLEDELAEEREKRRAAEERVEELESYREGHEKRHEALSQWADDLEERLVEVETKMAASEAVTSEDPEFSEDLTPMEQIARLPAHVASEQFDNENHRNTFRARSVVLDFGDYARKTPRGHVLKNAELCRVLTAQEDSRVQSKTGERVMDRIEELSDGLFEHVVPSENQHNEHILVLEDARDLNLGGDAAVS